MTIIILIYKHHRFEDYYLGCPTYRCPMSIEIETEIKIDMEICVSVSLSKIP